MATQLDSLEIVISTNTKQANTGIRSLTKNLTALQSFVSDKLDLGTITTLEEHLQNISKIDFTNVSQGLKDVVSAFKQLNNAQSKFKTRQTNNTKAINLLTNAGQGWENYEPPLPKIDLPQSQLPSFANSEQFSVINQEMEKLSVSLNQVNQALKESDKSLEALGNAMAEAGLNGTQMEKVLSTIGGETSSFTQSQIDNVRRAMEELGYSSDQISYTMEKLKSSIKKTGAEAGIQAKGGFQKLISAFSRILFYRVIRRVLQLIVQALKEGIQNVALFDENFNKTMSNIKSSLSYLKNSVGTALAPIIEMLEPIITMVLDGLSGIVNKLSEIFSAMAGKDTFTKATKGAEDYAKSLKKVKDTTLGIDELNIIKPEEQNENFETAEVEKNAITDAFREIGDNLRKIFGIIIPPIKKLVGAISNFAGKVLPPIFKAISEILIPIAEFVGELLDAISPLILSIADFLVPILKVVADIIKSWIQMIMPLLKDFLVPLIKNIINILQPILQMVQSILVPVLKVISTIFEALRPVYQIIAHVLNTIIEPIFPLIAGLLEIIQPLLDLISVSLDIITIPIQAIGKVIEWIANLLDGIVGAIGGAIKGFFEKVVEFTKTLFNKILGTVGDVLENRKNKETAESEIKQLSGEAYNSIMGYATGGFPEDGLFYANHNELVGQFSNGQTVVANNEQIIQGIKQGVYEAITLAGSNDNGGTQVIVYLDSREIAKRVEELNLSRSGNNIRGAYKYGG